MFGNFHTYFYSLTGSVLIGLLLFGILSERMAGFPGIYIGLLFFGVCSAKGVPLLLVPLSLLPVLVYRLCQRKLGVVDLKFSAIVVSTALVLRVIEYGSLGQVMFKKFNILNSSIAAFANVMEVAPFVLLLLVIAMQNRLAAYIVLKNIQYIIFVTTMFVTSIVMTRVIDFAGGFQYFFWYFRVFFFVLVAYCFGYALEKPKRMITAMTLSTVIISVSIFAYYQYNAVQDEHSTQYNFTLNDKEWDGLLWAYNNLDHRSRFVSNGAYGYDDRNGSATRSVFGPLDYLAVSGLYGYAWLYGWRPDDVCKIADSRLAVVNAFWKATSPDEQQRLLAAIPVDYLFVRKREDRGLDYTGLAGVRRIYTNEDFDIYALRGAAPQNGRSADRAL